jgi:thiosulfate dehydrogenase
MAAQARSVDQLKAILKGAANPKHDFSSSLDDSALTHLANFLKHGLMDLGKVIASRTGKPVNADVANGKQLFVLCATCHGPEGNKLNFANPDRPEYIGTLAKADPWMFLHKVRVGSAGSAPPMPTGVELGWKLQDMLDILAYSQTLR